MIGRELLSQNNLWVHLQEAGLPIVIYGMGNGADKIIDELHARGLEVSDFFASDGFVRGHMFHGKRVLSFSEIREKYEACIILIAFGSSLPEVMERLIALASEYEVYAPDVPVCGGELFDAEFYLLHENEFDRVRALFADEASREVFDDLISYKLSGNISYLLHANSSKEDALRGILKGNYTAYLDLGAYNGDTIREALCFYPTLQKICAFEPSVKTFAKLSAYLETVKEIEISAFPVCAWNQKETRILTDGSGRNTAIGGTGNNGKTKNGAKIRTVECDMPDALVHFQGERLFIKYDVEGAEREAILGSGKTIVNNDTDLLVSLYHKSADLFDLPLLVHELLPNHKLYLRKHPYIPAWDINLYVVKS